MIYGKDDIFKKLTESGVRYTVFRHLPVYTVEDMEKLSIPGIEFVTKNLFLRDDKGKNHYLVVLDKDKKADLKAIKNQIGSRPLSFASEDRLMKYLGLKKGAVTPLGILNNAGAAVTVVLDKSLAGRGTVGIHPNDNTATIFISYEDLLVLIRENGNEIKFADV